MGFYADVAALLDGDDNEKAKTAANMQFYSFYYSEEPYNKSLKTPQLQSDRVDKSGNKKNIDALEAEDLQAAKEGRLFIVSGKKPFLMQVTVGDSGNVRLDVVNRNPIKIPDGVSEKEQKSWGNLKDKFDTLIIGNADSNLLASFRRSWKAKKAAKEIALLAEEAEKHQFDELKTEDEDELEEVKQDEAKQEEKAAGKNEELQAEKTEVEQKEEIKEEKNIKESATEKAESLIKQGNHVEAAAFVAAEIKKKSDIFTNSKLIEGDALEAGMEIRKLLNLARSNKNLMDELEKVPQFKENKNLYQGQANLSEMAQKGKESYEILTALSGKQASDQNDKTNEMTKQDKQQLILDVMTGEAANALKNYKAMKGMLDIVEAQPDSTDVIASMQSLLEGSKEVEELSAATTKELENLFSKGFQKQRAFIGAFNDAKEKLANNLKESPAELAKEIKNENTKENQKKNENASRKNEKREPVLKNEDALKRNRTLEAKSHITMGV